MIRTLNPAAGGPSEIVRVLVEYKPKDSDVEVLTLDDPSAPFVLDAGFTVHALGPVRTTYGHSGKLLSWLKANRNRFDGVVVHGLWQSCGIAVRRSMKGHVPYTVFPHGMLDPYFRHAYPMKHGKKWLYWIAAEYWVLRGAMLVLFTCDAERDLAKQSFWPHRWNPWVVPFGTIPPTGDAQLQQEAFYGIAPTLRGKRFLLFLGRIHPKKGCDLLIEAFVKLAASDPQLHLVMAGPDPQNRRADLELTAISAGVAERVHWPGMLQGDAKWGAFYASEAFVLSSHQENFGIAVAEAMACARPVLLSDKVNIAAEIAADGAGLMEVDTAEGTERLLARWIALPEADRAAMGECAIECFHRRYDLRENAKAIVEIFAAQPNTLQS